MMQPPALKVEVTLSPSGQVLVNWTREYSAWTMQMLESARQVVLAALLEQESKARPSVQAASPLDLSRLREPPNGR